MFWEKRNLGVLACEVTLKTNEDMNEFGRVIDELEANYDYLCVRVESSCSRPLFELPKHGFTYVEDSILLRYSVKNSQASPMIEKLNKATGEPLVFTDITDDDARFNWLLRRIEEDQMFETDRIALDPAFGLEASNRRYVGWCKDLRESGSRFYLTGNEGHEKGFSVYTKHSESHYSSPLGGSFKTPDGNPFGSPKPMKMYIDYLISKGMKTLDTTVSSNNRVMLQFHQLCGLHVRDIYHVYIKHVKTS